MPKTLTTTEKAAILVANLDRQTADVLLDQMTREQASAVRRAVIELDDVDPRLIEEVLEEFRALNGGRRSHGGGGEVTWEPSGASAAYPLDDLSDDPPWNIQAHRLNEVHAAPHFSGATMDQRFACLRGAEPATVASYFSQEHPQTIAVVFSHLAPEQSADILARLPAARQAEVLHRLADLEDTDPEVLRDIETSIEEWLREQDRHGQRRRAGRQAIERILASAELGAKHEILSNLGQQDYGFARQFGYMETSADEPAVPRRDCGPAAATEPEVILATRLRAPVSSIDHATPVEPTITFSELEHLGDQALAEIFGRAEPEVIRIALAGAPRAMVQGILSRLPAPDRQLLERALSRLGPMRISDVELSQRHLAHLANELLRAGKATAPRRTA
ncbi:MAG: FliG C-terminal domain-containing protein [Pirellulales bacterium]